MADNIHLGVRNRSTGESYVTACILPVLIGRRAGADIQVMLDGGNKRISREHGIIELGRGGLLYRDQSGNGSQVDGREVRGSRVALQAGFQLQIDSYTITEVKGGSLVVLSTDLRLNEMQRLELLPGRGIGVAASGRRADLIDLNRWDTWDRAIVGRFELAQTVPVFEQSDGGQPVTRNNARLTLDRTRLSPLDVLKTGETRIELFHFHTRHIVCGFDRCQLLNPPPLAANCRHCGHDLANAGSQSRFLAATSNGS